MIGEARPARWNGLIVSLHWTAAAIILGLIALGWAMIYGGLDAATTFDLFQWHKSLGFVALAFTAIRLAARAYPALRRQRPCLRHGSDAQPQPPRACSMS